MAIEILTTLLLGFIQIAVGFTLSVFSVYFALRLMDKMTGDIDEWKEMKKGNIAVGLLFASVILSVVLIVEPTIVSSIALFSARLTALKFIATIIFVGVNTGIAIFFGIMSIYLSIRGLDYLTYDVNEITELKKGNVAVALYMSAFVLAVAIILSGTVTQVVNSLYLVSYLKLMG